MLRMEYMHRKDCQRLNKALQMGVMMSLGKSTISVIGKQQKDEASFFYVHMWSVIERFHKSCEKILRL